MRVIPEDHDAATAAILHDILENTDTSEMLIRATFGSRVLTLVKLLTNEPVSPNRNRADRHRSKLSRFSGLEGEDAIAVHSIKLADLIDNVPSIERFKPDFYPLYKSEAIDLIGVLGKGHPILIAKLATILGLATPSPT